MMGPGQTGVGAYAFETRVLLCGNCGAPLQIGSRGGVVTCAFCKASTEHLARSSLPTFTPPRAAELAEPARLAGLRAQMGRIQPAPATLASLLENGGIPAWREREAFAVWQSSRTRAAQGDLGAAEELVFLTRKLGELLSARGDALRQRAMLESALEAVSLPRHRGLMAAELTHGAARERDLPDAERWLALCDPRSEDLPADSAYRTARGLVETMHGHHDDVLQVIGRDARIPMADEQRPLASLLRAQALSAMGQRSEAIASLTDIAAARREAARHAALGFDTRLLDEAEAAGAARRAARAATTRRGSMLAGVAAIAVLSALVAAGLIARHVRNANRSFPIEASQGETVVIDGRTGSTAGALVECSSGCKVAIRNSKLSAGRIVALNTGDASVTIENSVLQTTAAPFEFVLTKPGIRVDVSNSELSYPGQLATVVNTTIDVRAEKSTFRSAGEAKFAIEVIGSLLLRQSKVLSESGGIQCFNGEVAIEQGSEVRAKATAVEVVEGTLRLDHSKATGAIGVRLIYKTREFTARSAVIEGTQSAIEGTGQALFSIDKETSIKGGAAGLRRP